MKRITLTKLETVIGKPFRNVLRDAEGNVLQEVAKDVEGNPITETPRDKNGVPLPGASPLPVYRPRTEAMGKEALKELLKSLCLSIPADKFTRQDSIFAVKLFENIKKSTDSVLELDEDVHDWCKKKLLDEQIGVKIFGVNLAIIENALDNFERPYEKGEKKK